MSETLDRIKTTHKTVFKQDDRVEIKDDIFGVIFGTVVGVVHLHITDVFIIELEEELPGYPFTHYTARYDNMEKVDP